MASTGSSSRRARVPALAVAVAVALGVLGAGALLMTQPGPADLTAPPGPSEDPAAPRIAFLGDSLTVGVGAPSERGYAWLTAAELDWPVAVVDGVSGSGYVAPGAGRPMPDRVERVIAAGPDVVVVVGGTNDAGQGYPPQEVGTAAVDLLDDLRDGLPDATVVVVGPFPTSAEAMLGDHPVADAVRSAADAAGAHYIDARELLDSPSVDLDRWEDYISADGLHPNELGYQLLADLLAERLRSIVPEPAPAG